MYLPTHCDTPIIHYLRRLRARLPEGRPLPMLVWESRHRSILILLWLHALGIACFGIVTNLQTSSADTAISGFICFLSATALGVEADTIPLASFANGLLQYVFDGGLIALAAIVASLLVEDDAVNREMLARYMALMGYDVLTAINGIQAVDIAQVQSPDIILGKRKI